MGRCLGLRGWLALRPGRTGVGSLSCWQLGATVSLHCTEEPGQGVLGVVPATWADCNPRPLRCRWGERKQGGLSETAVRRLEGLGLT